MHLGHQMPNLWYEAHLRSGDFDVWVGLTFAGNAVRCLLATTSVLAWGFTNVEPTVQDLYIETFNGAGEYQTPSGFLAPEHRREIIHVKRRGRNVAFGCCG